MPILKTEDSFASKTIHQTTESCPKAKGLTKFYGECDKVDTTFVVEMKPIVATKLKANEALKKAEAKFDAASKTFATANKQFAAAKLKARHLI